MQRGYRASWQMDRSDRPVRMLRPGVAASPLQALRPPRLLHLAGHAADRRGLGRGAARPGAGGGGEARPVGKRRGLPASLLAGPAGISLLTGQSGSFQLKTPLAPGAAVLGLSNYLKPGLPSGEPFGVPAFAEMTRATVIVTYLTGHGTCNRRGEQT